jgi:hypothetical protein
MTKIRQEEKQWTTKNNNTLNNRKRFIYTVKLGEVERENKTIN